jgi:hypothetical protein
MNKGVAWVMFKLASQTALSLSSMCHSLGSRAEKVVLKLII